MLQVYKKVLLYLVWMIFLNQKSLVLISNRLVIFSLKKIRLSCELQRELFSVHCQNNLFASLSNEKHRCNVQLIHKSDLQTSKHVANQLVLVTWQINVPCTSRSVLVFSSQHQIYLELQLDPFNLENVTTLFSELCPEITSFVQIYRCADFSHELLHSLLMTKTPHTRILNFARAVFWIWSQRNKSLATKQWISDLQDRFKSRSINCVFISS